MNNQYLSFKIEEFYQARLRGEYQHAFELAQALEKLADLAWDEVDDLYQSAITIP